MPESPAPAVLADVMPSTKAEVAALSCANIETMSRETLVDVVLAADLPMVRQRFEEHLQFYDRSTLERLAFQARRYCRNRPR